MAGLNLQPDPLLIAAHGVVFAAAVAVTRGLFIRPYLMLKEKRNSVTNEKLPESIRESADQIRMSLQNRLEQELSKQKEECQRELIALKSRLAEMVIREKSEAENRIQSAKKQIHQQLMEEQKKVQSIVERLAPQVIGKMTQS